MNSRNDAISAIPDYPIRGRPFFPDDRATAAWYSIASAYFWALQPRPSLWRLRQSMLR